MEILRKPVDSHFWLAKEFHVWLGKVDQDHEEAGKHHKGQGSYEDKGSFIWEE